MTRRLLILGAGYSGRAIARALAGEAEWIGGTTRSEERFGAIAAAGAEPLLFDGKTPSTELIEAAATATDTMSRPKRMVTPTLATPWGNLS